MLSHRNRMHNVIDKSGRDKTASGEPDHRAQDEGTNDARLFELTETYLKSMGPYWNQHQAVFLRRQSLSRLIYYYELYKLIVDVPGIICEFGVHWGAGMTTLMSLRGMYEPFNFSRQIVGFDTFEGFQAFDAEDSDQAAVGDFATITGYEKILEEILSIQETFSPLSHIKKFELVKGDASITVPRWLEANAHVIVAMAIFDMDLYKPTKESLTAVLPRLIKGSLLIFDELTSPNWEGEIKALTEVIGLGNLRLRRHPHQPHCAFDAFGE